MELNNEVAAAWAQAILSALAIVVSTLLAIYIPARERKLARMRQEMDAGRRLLWAATALISQYLILRPELERRHLKTSDITAQFQRINIIAEDMRTVQIVDVPTSMIELLWRTQILISYFAIQWEALLDPAFDGRSILSEADEFHEIAKKTGRELSAVKIGGRSVGNPNADMML